VIESRVAIQGVLGIIARDWPDANRVFERYVSVCPRWFSPRMNKVADESPCYFFFGGKNFFSIDATTT
jgi:hypothetical protein